MTHYSFPREGTYSQSIQQIPPNGRSAISRLGSVRRQHNDMGVSERSSKLIVAQTQLISQPGKDGVAGVLNGKLIPFMWGSTLLRFLSRPV